MPELFDPITINSLELVNRLVRSATWAGLATDDGQVTPELCELLAGVARGGVGLAITGHAYVHKSGKHAPRQLGVDTDEMIPGLARLAAAVHEAGGKLALQLGYGGHYLSRSRVEAMTPEQMASLAGAYGLAAARAREAGIDAVQIFAAHGFFLSQMLCPRYNRRTDQYGGPLENRARALMEALAAVRGAVGPGYPVLAKLNASDYVDEGLTVEESLSVAGWLGEAGLDALELSGGLLNAAGRWGQRIESEEQEAWFKSEAEAFQDKLDIPLIVGGGIRSYGVAAGLIESGIADLVAMSRPFICEPGLARRWQEGDTSKAACISCNNCMEEIKAGRGVSCLPLAEEPQEFFPQAVEDIPAGPPLAEGAAYRVSLGLVQQDLGFVPAVKVEMLKGDKVVGEPVFPVGFDHLERVQEAVARLLAGQGDEGE